MLLEHLGDLKPKVSKGICIVFGENPGAFGLDPSS